MNNTKTLDTSQNLIKYSYREVVAHLFFAASIIASTVLCFFVSRIRVEKAFILLLGSVFVLFNVKKSQKIILLQKITLLYLIGVLFNQLSLQFTQISSGRTNITVPLSLIILVPLAVGFALKKINRPNLVDTDDLLAIWVVLFAVIILHIVILFLLLKRFYGYGFERNFAVLGGLFLYFLVFLFSWLQLENACMRQFMTLVLAILFTALIIAKM